MVESMGCCKELCLFYDQLVPCDLQTSLPPCEGLRLWTDVPISDKRQDHWDQVQVYDLAHMSTEVSSSYIQIPLSILSCTCSLVNHETASLVQCWWLQTYRSNFCRWYVFVTFALWNLSWALIGACSPEQVSCEHTAQPLLLTASFWTWTRFSGRSS